MSLAEVQERTALLAARLSALQPPAPATVAAADSFPVALRQVAAATGATAAAAPARVAAGSSGTDLGQKALDTARSVLGTPYRWGGNKPGGFDCSGLVQWAYAQQGITLPRVSGDQAKAGREVTAAEARPGDLVFFEHGAIDHIGMYAGNGTWIEAPHTGADVRIRPVDLSKATHIRRVAPETSAAAAAGPAAAPTGAWAAGLPAGGQRYAALIEKAAAAAGIDPRLVASVAWSESGFSATARSPVGAQGLMQLMPATAKGLGVDPLDPLQALTGGAQYLATQLRAFGGRTDLALAAYNAGPSAVRKYGGVPPYSETQNYVRTVLAHLTSLGGSS